MVTSSAARFMSPHEPPDAVEFRQWLLEDKTRLTAWLDELLGNEAAATLAGYDPGSFANLRYRGRGPRFIRTPGRVRYRRLDVLRWLHHYTVGTGDDPLE